VDGMVSSGRAFDALKAIRGLYALEDQILNDQEINPATVEQIRKEIAPWHR
jgi:flagellar biosynthesis repressor protein FlbT